MSDDTSVRLNKYLALHMGTSRREADAIIAQGKVMINDQLAPIGARVGEGDEVRVKGKLIESDTAMRYIALNKPVGYVCSRRRQGDNPTIYELLPTELSSLKPVGRLDKDSSGLLLLSNDGDFALRMTHPRFSKVKRYDIELDKPLEPLHQQMISDFGIDLDDGKSQLTLERMSNDRMKWVVIMSEGRNRQIRRTFAALGYTVAQLHRTNFGNYTLGNLAPGEFEIVSV